MVDGKWIPDLHPATAIVDAARHVLTIRLEVVRDRLPSALQEADQDPEYVHQLRVSTRRARAALDIFSNCLPDKNFKRARSTLRKIRRAAGDVRDWDVFLQTMVDWEKRQGERQRAGVDCLIGAVIAHRLDAQKQLESLRVDYPFAFDHLIADTVAAVRKPQDGQLLHLIDLAQPMLVALLQELDQAASRNIDDYSHLHQVRIIGKRLRYAMEVFADCFATPFREVLYPTIEQLQEILGNANDSHGACARLELLRDKVRMLRSEDWKRLRYGVESLLRYHQKRLPREKQRFLRWWKQWQTPRIRKLRLELSLEEKSAAPLLPRGINML